MLVTVELEIAKPIPGAAPPICGSVAASVGIPTTCPCKLTSAPPLLPGLIGALVWITSGSTTPLGSETVRPSALMIPMVTELRSPSGLPSASTMSDMQVPRARERSDRQRRAAHADDSKIVLGKRADQGGREAAPARVGNPVGTAAGDDVRFGDDVSLLFEHDPRAKPMRV